MKIKCFFNTFLIVMLSLMFSSNSALSKNLSFAVASDVHYSERNNNAAKKALTGFVSRVNENHYDFVIFLGDNIEKSKQENLEGFLSTVKKIKTPYYLVLGNRDAHKISGIEKKDYLLQVSKSTHNQPKDSGSYCFCPNSDMVVIVLDNVSSGMPSYHGVFTQKTLLWLDEVLTKHKNKSAIIFQHVPFMQPYDKDTHDLLSPGDYRVVLSKHKNVLAVFSGHYHKEYFVKDSRKVVHISTPALFMHPYNYLDVSVEYKKPFLKRAKNIKINAVAKPAI